MEVLGIGNLGDNVISIFVVTRRFSYIEYDFR